MVGLTVALKRAFYPHFAADRALCRGVDAPNLRRRAARRYGQATDDIFTRMARGEKPRLNPEALMIVIYMRDHGLTLRRTQTALSHPSGIATRLDLETEAEDGSTVLLEIKTGFRGLYDAPHTRHPMKAPFGHMRDSFRNIHLLQLLATCLMYETAFPGRRLDIARSAVLVANEELRAVHPSAEDIAAARSSRMMVGAGTLRL